MNLSFPIGPQKIFQRFILVLVELQVLRSVSQRRQSTALIALYEPDEQNLDGYVDIYGDFLIKLYVSFQNKEKYNVVSVSAV
jgi:hypothetical protein